MGTSIWVYDTGICPYPNDPSIWIYCDYVAHIFVLYFSRIMDLLDALCVNEQNYVTA